MCIICLEYQKTKDLKDAWRMLQSAFREPGSIDKKHLRQLAIDLMQEEDFEDNFNIIKSNN